MTEAKWKGPEVASEKEKEALRRSIERQKPKHRTARIKVFRFDPSRDQKPRYETYEVPYEEGMRALEVLEYLRGHMNKSLALRYQCKIRVCGQCGALVNGEPKLLCWEKATDEMTFEPLPNFPIVRDLVVDRSIYYKTSPRFRAYLERKKPTRLSEAGALETIKNEEMKEALELGECIECLLCIAACPAFEALRNRPTPLMPTHMVQLARFMNDARDGLDRVPIAFFEGLYDCTTCRKCVEVCPVGLAIPDDVIEKIRAMAVKEGLGPMDGQKEFVQRVAETGRSIPRTTKPFIETLPEVVKVESHQDKVMYFPGCLSDLRLQNIAKATVDCLVKNNVEVVIPHAFVCCGSPLLRSGMIDSANELVEKNVRIIEEKRIKTLVTSCPGCGLTIKRDYPRLLGRELSFEIIPLAEYLTTRIELNVKDMKPINVRVTYHDPCHLNRGLKVNKEPRVLITKVPGVEFVEMKKSDMCCGSGGGVRAGRRELSYLIGRKKIQYIKETKADILLTNCPFCNIHIGDILETAGLPTEILDVIELLQRAYTEGT